MEPLLEPEAFEATRGFTDEIIQLRTNRERDRFVKKIKEKDVLAVAASHRDGMACEVFKRSVVGSWNVCFFVRFADGARWAVRVPLLPCLGAGARDKLESEVAAMQLVAERTSIPLPRLHGYRLGKDSVRNPLSNYLLLEYVDAKPASEVNLTQLSAVEEERFYSSLGDIYVQLRHLEFPRLGRLGRSWDGYDVQKPPNSLDINRQMLEGTDPTSIIKEYGDKGVLRSADQYTGMLLELADNGFLNSRSRVENWDRGTNILYHHHQFRLHVSHRFWESCLDKGPFVLDHGDLQLSNLLVNDKREIVAVLGWDWSRVVPIKLFQAPFFLTNKTPEDISSQHDYDEYLKTFQKFHAVLRKREAMHFAKRTLSNEWWRFRRSGGFLVSNALENWTAWHAFAMYHLTGFSLDTTSVLTPSISGFMDEAECRQFVLDAMCGDYEVYKKELRRIQIQEAKVRIGVSRKLRFVEIAIAFVASLRCNARLA